MTAHTPINQLKYGMNDVDIEGEIAEQPSGPVENNRGRSRYVLYSVLKDDTGQIKVGLDFPVAKELLLGTRLRLTHGKIDWIAGESSKRELVFHECGIHYRVFIGELREGMVGLDVEGEIVDTPEWQRSADGYDRTAVCTLRDKTGQVKIRLKDSVFNPWNKSTYDRVKAGSKVRITNGIFSKIRGEMVLWIGSHGSFGVNNT